MNHINIIELIKNKEITKLKELLLENKNINLDVVDSSNDRFIFFVLIYRLEEILDIVLQRKIKLDVFDIDHRSILYIPIKYGYDSMLKKLIINDKMKTGISIINITDKLGLSPLHYAIVFKNAFAFDLLLENGADILCSTKQLYNSFHICIKYGTTEFFIKLLNSINEINFYVENNLSLLQFALSHNRNDLIPLILKKKININNKESVQGKTILHLCIVKKYNNIITLLINNGIDVNIQDYNGNTALHYALYDNNIEIALLLLKHNIDCNYTNIDGMTGLHIYLSSDNITLLNNEVLRLLIINTDLNILNNDGVTCLKMLIDNHIIYSYEDILKNKELNFYITDELSSSLNENKILEIAINSYYNNLKLNNDKLTVEWEKKCSSNTNVENNDCYNMIKKAILNDMRSIPKYDETELILENSIYIKGKNYVGVPLDIICGLIYMFKTFKNYNMGVIIDYPLSVNKNVEEYYKKMGFDYSYKLNFTNCEILWSYHRLFLPTYFELEFKKKMEDKNIYYIVIPIGIEIANISHANILFIDKKNKSIERFEPHGSSYTIENNYNPKLLDNILRNKFDDYDLKYFEPQDFLPSIGFQILENINVEKHKKLSDPDGYCGVWCIWWVYHRMKNLQFSNKELVNNVIQTIKIKNINFRELIRNFSINIINIRDSLLSKYDLDIDDWMSNNVSQEIIIDLEKDIYKYFY